MEQNSSQNKHPRNLLSQLPTSISDAELLKAAASEEIVTFGNSNSVLRFLVAHGIEAGRYNAPISGLFALYCKWTDLAMGKRAFHNKIAQFLVKRVIRDIGFVRINKSITQLGIIENEIVTKKHNPSAFQYKKRHFDNFLAYYDLKAGKFFVESFILYHLYDRWTHMNGTKNTLGKPSFNEFCALYFRTRRNKDMLEFSVSSTIKHILPKEQMEEIRKGYKWRKRK
jgi:hypothetical protein